jgi:hypothetical protein
MMVVQVSGQLAARFIGEKIKESGTRGQPHPLRDFLDEATAWAALGGGNKTLVLGLYTESYLSIQRSGGDEIGSDE